MKDITPTERMSIDRFLEAMAATSGVSRKRLERVLFQGQSGQPLRVKQRLPSKAPTKPVSDK